MKYGVNKYEVASSRFGLVNRGFYRVEDLRPHPLSDELNHFIQGAVSDRFLFLKLLVEKLNVE